MYVDHIYVYFERNEKHSQNINVNAIFSFTFFKHRVFIDGRKIMKDT